jgi:hypothetical protein
MLSMALKVAKSPPKKIILALFELRLDETDEPSPESCVRE